MTSLIFESKCRCFERQVTLVVPVHCLYPYVVCTRTLFVPVHCLYPYIVCTSILFVPVYCLYQHTCTSSHHHSNTTYCNMNMSPSSQQPSSQPPSSQPSARSLSRKLTFEGGVYTCEGKAPKAQNYSGCVDCRPLLLQLRSQHVTQVSHQVNHRGWYSQPQAMMSTIANNQTATKAETEEEKLRTGLWKL